MKATKEEYLDACRMHHGLFGVFKNISRCHESEKEARTLDFLFAARAAVPHGLYEHWKSEEGNLKYYVVEGIGIEQDVDRPLVAYRALYRPHVGVLTFRHFLDDKFGFLAPIDRTAYQGPRFRLVRELSLEQIVTVLGYVVDLSKVKNSAVFRMHVDDILKKKVPEF